MAARIVFAGTPAFALASLKALVESGQAPVAVYTQPDRPAGRGRKLTASPVKAYALEQGIPVYQPQNFRADDDVETLRGLSPDLLVVAAYGLLLPQRVLDIPSIGCVNVHASLLPRWRGAAPIQAAIRENDAETGICLMAMTAGLDEGPVYARAALPIGDSETAGELHDRLAALGGKLLARELPAIAAGRRVPEAQDDARATYAAKIAREDGRLDWRRPAEALCRIVRAYNPVPGCFFETGSQRIKVWRAHVDAGASGPPGKVLASGPDGVVVACGEGALVLDELQRAGKGRVDAREFTAACDLTGEMLRNG